MSWSTAQILFFCLVCPWLFSHGAYAEMDVGIQAETRVAMETELGAEIGAEAQAEMLLEAEAKLHIEQASYIEDASGSLQSHEALIRLRSGEGGSFEDLRFNLGNNDTRYWVLIRLTNSGPTALERLIDFGVPFRADLRVVGVLADEAIPAGDEASVAPLLHTGDWEDFKDRGVPGLILHTPVFSVPASESLDLLMQYRTRGATYMPMSITTAERFLSEEQGAALRSAFFYAAALILLIVFFMFGLAMKEVIVLMYALMFGLILLFIASIEGYAYQYLWPNAPGWNQYASLFLLFLSSAYSFWLARVALAPALQKPWLRKLLLTAMLICGLLALLCTVLPFSVLVEAAGLLLLFASVIQAITISSWLTVAVRRNLMSAAGALLVLPISATLLILYLLGFEIPDLVVVHGTRFMFFLFVVFTLGALCMHVLALREDHEHSLQQALDAAQRDAQLSRELYESRREYERVQRMADRWKQNYAATSHDIRQPLISMRAALSDESLREGSPLWNNLTRSLDYLEALSSPDAQVHPDTGEQVAPSSSGEEPYPADLILNTITRMFADEAKERSVALRSVACRYELHVSPLALMRIVSNLVANGIKHAGGGDVLLGCRRIQAGSQHALAQGLRIDVIDNGPGIAQSELVRLQQAYQKGDASEGEGLGLAICWELAGQQGFTLTVESQLGAGTRFSLFVPS